jgi:hypothetical protein
LALLSDAELYFWLLEKACSHVRATEVYLSSLRNDCKFNAYPCPDCGPAVDCTKTIITTPNNTLIPFGKCSPHSDENYYVLSTAFEPFCDKRNEEVNKKFDSAIKLFRDKIR